MDNVATGEPQEGAPTVPTPVTFTGRRGYLFGLALKNAILTLCTLGFYRFWAKTRIRRYFWSNIHISGEPLEYTGLASELLIGFLKAIVILFVISAIQTTLQFLIKDDSFQILLNAAYSIFIGLLAFIAFYRMWQYRLSRTTWRGIRFGLGGSDWVYARQGFLWGIVTVLTLGLAYPWMRVAMTGYLANHARFGSASFSMEAKASRLFLPWLATLVFAVAAVSLTTWFIGPSMSELESVFEAKSDADPKQKVISFLWFVLDLSIIALVGALMFVWYRVREFRYLTACARFGEASFEFRLKTSQVVLLLVATWAVIFGLLVIGAVALFFPGDTSGLRFWMLVLGIPSILIGLSVAKTVIYAYGMVAAVSRTLTVAGVAAFDATVQSGDRGPAHGEGMADALDVGAF